MREIQKLHSSQGKLARDIQMRDAVEEFIEGSEPVVLRSLGALILDKDWRTSDIEDDLGAEAIECLIDEVNHMDYKKLKEVFKHLEAQGAFRYKKK